MPDASVDVVISNCVINLALDKNAVFREIARVLKPGGRMAVCDIALKQPLPSELAKNLKAWSGCSAGAIPVDDYLSGLRAAGLTNVVAVDDHADLNAYAKVEGQSLCCAPAPTELSAPPIASCCPPKPEATLHADLAALIAKHDINAFAASVKVYATKP